MKACEVVYQMSLKGAQVREALGAALRVRQEKSSPWIQTFYDTFDWRLFHQGGTLRLVSIDRTRWLFWHPGSSRPRQVPLEDSTDPAGLSRPADLPAGPLRDEIAALVNPRRLLPLVRLETRGGLLRILNRQEKTVVRVHYEQIVAQGNETGTKRRAALSLLRLEPVRGYDKIFRQVRRRLEGELGLQPIAGGLLEVALAAVGRRPGDTGFVHLPDLKSHLPAAGAMRKIHAALLESLRSNEEGVREGCDPEFLHDFRVAVRRTRAALSQIREVYPTDVVARFRREFAWLGKATGLARDLDVYLQKMDEYGSALPGVVRADLVPLGDFLQMRQRAEQQRLVETLNAQRYRQLIDGWDRFLQTPIQLSEETPNANCPIQAVASTQLLSAYQRLCKRGAAIGEDTPAAALHRLRIDAKKLRYLLEFFRELYPPTPRDRLVGALKQLQDNLGDFHDYEVQRKGLQVIAVQMSEQGPVPVATSLAMGKLVILLESRQVGERQRFTQCMARFAQAKNRKAFQRLFKT